MAFETHSMDFHHEGVWVAFCSWLEQRGIVPVKYPDELQVEGQVSHCLGLNQLKTKLS